jgi:hypothetical protein
MPVIPLVGFLPPPPGTPESPPNGGPNTLLVLVIVGLILGAVVLVAWLLKPLVAKRLRVQETMVQPDSETNSEVANARWNDSWANVSKLDDNVDTTPEVPGELVPPTGVEPNLLQDRDAEESAEDSETTTEPETKETQIQVIQAEENSETADIIAITTTVRTLLERANAGRIRDGFALYTDAALERFREETGLAPDEFDRAFEAVPPPPSDQQAELAAITDVDRLPDGRIRALISYGNGGTFPPPEYFTFVRANGDKWLIDEIAPAGG